MKKNQEGAPKKYADLLQQSQQEKVLQQVLFRAEEARLQLQGDILATQRELAAKQSFLVTLKGSYPFNSAAIIATAVEIDGLAEGLNRLQSLMNELF